VPDLATASREVGARELTHRVPFDAYHQSGIVSPKAAQATFVALDSVASTTTALFEGLQAISSQARLLTQGEPVGVAEIDDPPPDSGILGSYNAPRSTSWTRRAPAATCSSRSAPASATPWCTPSAG
jgi:deferrochelatase/peroxidase EfeB